MDNKDKEKWEIDVEEEYNKMKKYNVWTPIKLKDVIAKENIFASTWAMKKKTS